MDRKVVEIEVVGDGPASTGTLSVAYIHDHGKIIFDGISLKRRDGTSIDLIDNCHCLGGGLIEWFRNAREGKV